MRLPAPKVKTPVTPAQLSGLAVPFLWALMYPTDRFAVLFHLQGVWLYELLSFLTALAIFTVLIFSPRDDVVPWKQVPEPKQRIFFFISCVVSLGGIALLGLTGGGFWGYIYLALSVLSLLWLVLPYLVLSGNAGALKLLVFSMRMGLIWFTSMFFILAIRDGFDQIMNNNLPAVALGFMGMTYWFFLMTANRLVSDEAGEWPVFLPNWKKSYQLGLLLSFFLVLLWVLTGFTNDGIGEYSGTSYNLSFPFYDVAALLEPSSFSNGPLLLLHSIPWKEMFFPGEGSPLYLLLPLHWLGLSSLATAAFGVVAAFFSGMWPSVTRIFSVFAAMVAAATAFGVVSLWREFTSRLSGEADHFMLAEQHIPTLLCCGVVIFLAAALFVTLAKGYHTGSPA